MTPDPGCPRPDRITGQTRAPVGEGLASAKQPRPEPRRPRWQEQLSERIWSRGGGRPNSSGGPCGRCGAVCAAAASAAVWAMRRCSSWGRWAGTPWTSMEPSTPIATRRPATMLGTSTSSTSSATSCESTSSPAAVPVWAASRMHGSARTTVGAPDASGVRTTPSAPRRLGCGVGRVGVVERPRRYAASTPSPRPSRRRLRAAASTGW